MFGFNEITQSQPSATQVHALESELSWARHEACLARRAAGEWRTTALVALLATALACAAMVLS